MMPQRLSRLQADGIGNAIDRLVAGAETFVRQHDDTLRPMHGRILTNIVIPASRNRARPDAHCGAAGG